MLVRKQSDGTVVTEADFRRAFPNTSFPPNLTEELFTAFGYDVVFDGPQPTGEVWQRVESDGVEQVAGKWRTKFKLVPIFEDPEEQVAYVAEWEVANAPISPAPRLVASGVFSVTDGAVETIGVASCLVGGFAVDAGTYWIFFAEPQPDLAYAVYPSSSSGQINVSARTTEYFELCVKDGGALSDPTEFSVNVVRSQ